MSVTITMLPRDLLWQIGSFQSAGALLSMSQTCAALFKILQKIIQYYARMEHERLQIPYFRPSLTPDRVAWEWEQLPPERCRIVRTNLAAAPLVFYAGRFDAVTV